MLCFFGKHAPIQAQIRVGLNERVVIKLICPRCGEVEGQVSLLTEE